MKKLNVGILLFNQVEVLDFAGPFEVFSVSTNKDSNESLFNVKTVAQTKDYIKARNGLRVKPCLSFDDNPKFDVLIIPGGYGADEVEINNKELINWLKDQKSKVGLIASVCTGAFLLGKAGILDNKNATTHWMDIDRLKEYFPKINIKKNIKFIDEGDIITAAGISAGIDMSLYIVKKLAGVEAAKYTARRMEYDIDFDFG